MYFVCASLAIDKDYQINRQIDRYAYRDIEIETDR